MERQRPKKDYSEVMLKPLWKAPWFWIVIVAFIVVTLPIFNEDNNEIPEDVDDSFYYSAREAYEDFMQGWLDREVPDTISNEWTTYYYEDIHSEDDQPTDQEELTATEERVIEELHIMLEELSNYEEAWEREETYERETFFEAATEASDILNIEVDETPGEGA